MAICLLPHKRFRTVLSSRFPTDNDCYKSRENLFLVNAMNRCKWFSILYAYSHPTTFDRLLNNRLLLTRVSLQAECKRVRQIKNVTHENCYREQKTKRNDNLLEKVHFLLHKLLISITMAEDSSEMAIILPLR